MQTKLQAPGPQAGPALPALKNLIAAINSQDPDQIASFVHNNFDSNHTDQDSWSTRCCEPDEVTRTLNNVGKRSGGLIIESAYPHGSGITAFTRTKLRARKLYIDLECGNSEPCLIESYQMVALSPGPENFLPKPRPDVATETRLETLKRALRKHQPDSSSRGLCLSPDMEKFCSVVHTATLTEHVIFRFPSIRRFSSHLLGSFLRV